MIASAQAGLEIGELLELLLQEKLFLILRVGSMSRKNRIFLGIKSRFIWFQKNASTLKKFKMLVVVLKKIAKKFNFKKKQNSIWVSVA